MLKEHGRRLVPFLFALASSTILSGTGFAQSTVPTHSERGGLGLEIARKEFGAVPFAAGSTRTFPSFDRRLSLFITDTNTVEQISFEDVLSQLVEQSGDAKLTPTVLFQQWWDTQNLRPGLGLGPHCDDESTPDANNLSMMNKFPYRCPRNEGEEAQSDPFTNAAGPQGYTAIAMVNRFDLAAPDGIQCGQYRIVFARNSGKTDPLDRNLIIFEAQVPNPKPGLGNAGCRPIVEFWLALSDPTLDTKERGEKLREFYLNGLPGDGVGPIIAIANFSEGSGQIRSNQFLKQAGNFEWTLREFKLDAANKTLKVVPVSVKHNPGNALFEATTSDPRAADLVAEVKNQITDILGGDVGPGDVNAFSFLIRDDKLNSFESNERDANLGDVQAAFLVQPGGALETAISDALQSQASTLAPIDVVNRIGALTCAGCHEWAGGRSLGGGVVWPDSMGFTHESERDFETVAPDAATGNRRYAISPALNGPFLDAREANLKTYLQQF